MTYRPVKFISFHCLTVATIFLSAVPGKTFGEVTLKDVQWRAPKIAKAPGDAYETISQWTQPPAQRLAGKLRAVVSVVNRGPKAAEGVLLRYAIRAKLASIGDPADEGVWTVSFWQENRRIPLMQANQIKEVVIENLHLQSYLKDVFSSGFWPKELRIEIMAIPRSGESLQQHVLERALPVSWQTTSTPSPQ